MEEEKDILLVVPISKTHYVVPPIGLGYLASALRSNGLSGVAILDCIKEELSFKEMGIRLKAIAPKVIGFQVFSYDFNSVEKSISIIKRILPATIIVVGGPHVSAVGDSVLMEIKDADFGFIGEAENGFALLMRRVIRNEDIPFKDIPGLIWRAGDIVHSNQRDLVQDLDKLVFPAWDLIEPSSYPDNPQGGFYKKFPIAPILTSRGCPYLCTFCGSGVNMGRKLRLRSIDKVLAEMDILYNDFGVREFHIIDDMFNFHKERVMEFCQGIRKRGWNISYTFPNGLRLNQLDREVLQEMKDTGAYTFTVGIESGSQRILDLMQKNLTLKLIEEKVNLINSVGLEPNGFFILGYPDETIEDMEATIRFAKRLPLKRAHFSNFLPLPGTEATKRLIRDEEIKMPSWGTLFYSKVAYSPKGIDSKKLKKMQRKAFFEFYLRPGILCRMILDIKSVSHLKMVIKRAFDYLLFR